MTVSSGHEAAAGGVVGGVRRHAAKCADRQGQERSALIANNVLYDTSLCGWVKVGYPQAPLHFREAIYYLHAAGHL